MYKKIINRLFLKLKKVILSNKLLSIIIALAALLRFIGIYPGYHPYHSDEGMGYSSAIEMIKNLNLDPTRYDYPALIPIVNAIIYFFILIPIFVPLSFIFFPEYLPSFKNPLDLWQQFIYVNQQKIVLFWGRFVTAFFGIGVILLVYLVTKNLFKNKNAALIASFLTAVNYRQVLNSHLALPDIYNAFFLLLSIFFVSKLVENYNIKNYLFSAISVALSFSVKFQVFAFVPFLVVHLYISIKNQKGIVNFFQLFLSKKFLFGVILIPFIIVFLNFYHLLNWEEFRGVNSYTALKYSFGFNQLNTYSTSYLYYIGLGPMITISILAGILVGIWKNWKASLILLSVILPFLYVFIYYSRGGYYTRNFVTITPLLLIFAAIFIDQILNLLKVLGISRFISSVLLILLVVFISKDQIINSIISSYNYTKPWSFESARQWAKINIPENSVVISHPWDKYPRDKNLKIIPFEASDIFSIAEMQEEKGHFGFINLDWVTLRSSWWMNKIPPDRLLWQKPVDILSNTHAGVAGRELCSFAVAAFIKPWQATEMNIVIIKIPEKIKIEEKEELARFDFDNSDVLKDWILVDDLKFTKSKIYQEDGALKIEMGSRAIPITRAISPVISINSNSIKSEAFSTKSKAFIVEGEIKSSNLLDKKNRDGFLRVDFYLQKPNLSPTTRSLYTALSSRHFGSADWVKKEVVVIPPPQAKFMTVSFQVDGNSDFYLDNLRIYQSEDEFENPRSKSPYIDYQVSDDILFPYSQGGL